MKTASSLGGSNPIEHQGAATWAENAFNEKNAARQLEALMALAQVMASIQYIASQPTHPWTPQ
jgi:hypothetical protein